jgi:hypothetical protein
MKTSWSGGILDNTKWNWMNEFQIIKWDWMKLDGPNETR